MPKKPAPFKTPSIDLTAHGKSWQSVLPGLLTVGDHIMNFGIITEIDNNNGLTFTFAGSDLPVNFDAGSVVLAFTKTVAEGE